MAGKMLYPELFKALERVRWNLDHDVPWASFDASKLSSLLDSAHLLVRGVAACGLAREESRGVHFREDFPVESEELAGHLVVHPGRDPVLERWS